MESEHAKNSEVTLKEYYEQVGAISSQTKNEILQIAKQFGEWSIVRDEAKHFYTKYATEELKGIVELQELWPTELWHEAWFLKIPAGGNLHRHKDSPKPWKTYHIPIKTNKKAICYMYENDDTEIVYHLKTSKIYLVNRICEHASINGGSTDRIHLLMEVHDA